MVALRSNTVCVQNEYPKCVGSDYCNINLIHVIPDSCEATAALPAPEGEQGPLCAWLTSGLPFCRALRLATLILHTLPYVCPSLPHTRCSVLHRQTPREPRRLPAAGILHSRPSPQGRSSSRPQGSPSRGAHTRQQSHRSGTYPPGQLGLGHRLTSHREAHWPERAATARSRVKTSAAASRSSCIVMDIDSVRKRVQR